MQANWANIDKAREILNWEPDINLLDGIAQTVEWYQSERQWAKYIKTI